MAEESSAPVAATEAPAQQSNQPDLSSSVAQPTAPKEQAVKVEAKPEVKPQTSMVDAVRNTGVTQSTAEAPPIPKPQSNGTFANPFVETLNRMYQENRSPDEVSRYMSLHQIDVEAMPYGQAVLEKMKLEHPYLDNDGIEIMMKRQYGSLPSEDDPGYAQAKATLDTMLKVDGNTAKAWLKAQKAGYDNPEAVQARANAEAEARHFENQWQGIAQKTVNSPQKLSFSLQDDKIGGGTYSLDYNVQMTPEQKTIVAEQLANYAKQFNIPPTEEGRASLEQFKEAMLWNMNRESFLKEMAFDLYASLQKEFAKKYAQGGTIRQTTQTRTGTPEPVSPPKRKDTPGFI